MTRALARHESGEACVIPIILRQVYWQDALFSKLQVLPKDAKPVKSWSDQDEAFFAVEEGIREAINSLCQSPANTQPPSKPPWIVPYPPNQHFTDRQGTLSHLRYTFTTSKVSTLIQQAIQGIDGMGKTQCALQYAYDYRNDYQAVLWTNATSRETFITDFVHIARKLYLPGRDAQDQTIAVNAVKQWLETHAGWLLILDNADDLDLINPFLPSEGEGHILLTTRNQILPMKHINVTEMEPEDGILFLLRQTKLLQRRLHLMTLPMEIVQ